MGGWDELREDDKERIQRAWEEGDIPDNEKPEPAHSKWPRYDYLKRLGDKLIFLIYFM